MNNQTHNAESVPPCFCNACADMCLCDGPDCNQSPCIEVAPCPTSPGQEPS